MTAIEHYFWQLDTALADVQLARRNQIVSAVRDCVADADAMMVFGKPVEMMTAEELDSYFGSVDYICFVAKNDIDELHQWGRLMTSINAFIPDQKQGYWLAIAAIYDMDRNLPATAAKKMEASRVWQQKKINYSTRLGDNIINVYLPLLLSAACFVSLVMPIFALIPAVPTVALGTYLLVRERGETWVATASIATGALALMAGGGALLAEFL